ncbi:MAG: hypothetical protein ACREA0_00720, partial [bacterium]
MRVNVVIVAVTGRALLQRRANTYGNKDMTQRALRSEAALRHRLLMAHCLALLVMPLCAAAATASVHPLASELLHYLGFKPGDRGAVLEKGGVLQSGLTAGEDFPEEVAAVGA